MKKIFTLTIAAAVLLSSTSSCVRDFLDVKPRGRDIASNINHYIGMLNHNTLLSMAGSSMYVYLGEELLGDATTMNRLQQQEKDQAVKAIKFEKGVYADNVSSAEWDNSYSKIYTYNVIIDEVMDAQEGTELQKQQIQAEARMQRAYMHFYASIFFTKPYNASTAAQDLSIPIMTKADTQAKGLKRATTQELYSWIIQEMTEALPLLPEGYGITRVYQAAGNYLLGRVYWYMGEYEKALPYLKTSFEKSKAFSDVKLLSYRTNNTTWLGGKEYYTNYPTLNLSSETLAIRTKTQSNLANPTAIPINYIKPEYVDMYKAGDLRANLLFKYTTGYYKVAGRTQVNVLCDLPELYFMYAECEARIGNENTAREVIYEYRKSRFSTDVLAEIPATVSSKNELIKFIVNERTLEYMGRGASAVDMKRLWHDPIFAFKKANFTHPILGDKTYVMNEEDQLTWNIPSPVMNFNLDWIDN